MSTPNRRDFIQSASAGVAGAATFSVARGLRGAGADSHVRVGIIGCGGRGSGVSMDFHQQPNVTVTHLCDVHEGRLGALATKLEVSSQRAVKDMRRVLDDPDVDAVYIATPDHWHAPAAILACEAGKHVYVEKACSHNLREGRLLVEAARRNERVVQHGTQVRSTRMFLEAMQLLNGGIIGDVLVSRAWNVQRRGNIGHQRPSAPPPDLDYDTWVGPAPLIPYQQNLVDGWHWCLHFGTGGIGNDGIHDVEYARWGLGVQGHPSKISAAGGKYFFDDDQEFPDTHQVAFEYPGDGKPGSGRMLIYEQRLWSTNYPSVYNVDSGVEYYGTQGRMFLSRRGKIQVLGDRNKPIKIDIERESQDTNAHVADFIDAIRSDRRPNADIELGHLTASLCHLGNLSTRVGRCLEFDADSEQIVGDEEANSLIAREYRDHWGTPAGV